MDTNAKEILALIETAVTAQFPTLSGQFCAEEEFLHIWKYSPVGIRYLPNFHLIFEADGYGNVIARQGIFILILFTHCKFFACRIHRSFFCKSKILMCCFYIQFSVIYSRFLHDVFISFQKCL